MKYLLTFETFEQPKEKKDKAKEREKEKETKKKKRVKDNACKHPEKFRIQLPYGERCQLCKIKLK